MNIPHPDRKKSSFDGKTKFRQTRGQPKNLVPPMIFRSSVKTKNYRGSTPTQNKRYILWYILSDGPESLDLTLLVQLAQRDPVINGTDVTSSRCDRLAQMALSDDFSTFGRSFRTIRYVSIEQLINEVRYPCLSQFNIP